MTRQEQDNLILRGPPPQSITTAAITPGKPFTYEEAMRQARPDMIPSAKAIKTTPTLKAPLGRQKLKLDTHRKDNGPQENEYRPMINATISKDYITGAEAREDELFRNLGSKMRGLVVLSSPDLDSNLDLSD